MTDQAKKTKTSTAKLKANQKYNSQFRRTMLSWHKQEDKDVIEAIEQYKAERKDSDMTLSKLVAFLLREHFGINQKNK